VGYDIHITRKTNWFDESGPEITVNEWRRYIESDPEMRLDGYAEAKCADGSVLRVNDSSMAVWIKHPEHESSEGLAWLWVFYGNIQAKNPDEHTRRKMWQIANTLSAKVQGDEGEQYDEQGNVIAAITPKLVAPTRDRRWWQFWQ
jgi:hypothetical protein